MSKARISDTRNLSEPELRSKKEALFRELHALRQKKIVGQLEKPHLFKQFRRQIAQISTIQKERQGHGKS